MKNILIADDSMFMRMSLKKILTNHDYNVVGEASNGKEAFEKYKELSPDVVFMDITMNEMTGLEALEKILEYDSKAKVIMVSAMGHKYFIEQAVKLGAKGFLVKPFNEEQVVSVISRI